MGRNDYPIKAARLLAFNSSNRIRFLSNHLGVSNRR